MEEYHLNEWSRAPVWARGRSEVYVSTQSSGRRVLIGELSIEMENGVLLTSLRVQTGRVRCNRALGGSVLGSQPVAAYWQRAMIPGSPMLSYWTIYLSSIGRDDMSGGGQNSATNPEIICHQPVRGFYL